MAYCTECGTELIMKEHPTEGVVPFCTKCEAYKWPGFNTAVSMVVLDHTREHVLLIKLYGRPFYVLVAGYVNKGEDAEDAVAREIREEIGAEVAEISFNHSHYFPPSNTLMLNFTAVLKGEDLHTNDEVDSYKWFTIEDARKNVRPSSLASAFLNGYFDKTYTWPDLTYGMMHK